MTSFAKRLGSRNICCAIILRSIWYHSGDFLENGVVKPRVLFEPFFCFVCVVFACRSILWRCRSWAFPGTGTLSGLGRPCSTASTARTRSREGELLLCMFLFVLLSLCLLARAASAVVDAVVGVGVVDVNNTPLQPETNLTWCLPLHK